MAKAAIVYDLNKQATAAKVLADNIRLTFGNDEDLIGTAIEGETDLFETAENAVDRLVVLEAYMHGIEGKIEALKARCERFKNQHAKIKEALHLALHTAEMPKIELAVATVSTRKLQDECEIVDETEVPAKYWVTPPTPDPKIDKKAILEALQNKENIPGTRLNGNRTTLSIKYK